MCPYVFELQFNFDYIAIYMLQFVPRSMRPSHLRLSVQRLRELFDRDDLQIRIQFPRVQRPSIFGLLCVLHSVVAPYVQAQEVLRSDLGIRTVLCSLHLRQHLLLTLVFRCRFQRGAAADVRLRLPRDLPEFLLRFFFAVAEDVPVQRAAVVKDLGDEFPDVCGGNSGVFDIPGSGDFVRPRRKKCICRLFLVAWKRKMRP